MSADIEISRTIVDSELIPSLDATRGPDYLIFGPRRVGRSALIGQVRREINARDDLVALQFQMYEANNERNRGLSWTESSLQLLNDELTDRLSHRGVTTHPSSDHLAFFKSVRDVAPEYDYLLLVDDVCLVPDSSSERQEAKEFLKKIRTLQEARKRGRRPIWRFFFTSKHSLEDLDRLYAFNENESPFNETKGKVVLGGFDQDELDRFVRSFEEQNGSIAHGQDRADFLRTLLARTGGHPLLVRNVMGEIAKRRTDNPLKTLQDIRATSVMGRPSLKECIVQHSGTIRKAIRGEVLLDDDGVEALIRHAVFWRNEVGDIEFFSLMHKELAESLVSGTNARIDLPHEDEQPVLPITIPSFIEFLEYHNNLVLSSAERTEFVDADHFVEEGKDEDRIEVPVDVDGYPDPMLRLQLFHPQNFRRTLSELNRTAKIKSRKPHIWEAKDVIEAYQVMRARRVRRQLKRDLERGLISCEADRDKKESEFNSEDVSDRRVYLMQQLKRWRKSEPIESRDTAI